MVVSGKIASTERTRVTKLPPRPPQVRPKGGRGPPTPLLASDEISPKETQTPTTGLEPLPNPQREGRRVADEATTHRRQEEAAEMRVFKLQKTEQCSRQRREGILELRGGLPTFIFHDD